VVRGGGVRRWKHIERFKWFALAIVAVPKAEIDKEESKFRE
jgi:hypothetical protein